MPKVITIRLRYTGEAVDDHNMDVTHLGSSLFAVGELCRLANRQFNKDDANVHVLVRTDQEHQCFEIVLEVFNSFMANAQELIGKPKTKDIKEILEWIGILISPFLFGVGLYKYLEWKRGRKIESTKIEEKKGKETVTVKSEKGDSITIVKEVWEMSKNKEIVKMAGKTIEPLQKDGYSTIEFEKSSDEIQQITKEQAGNIAASVRVIDDQLLEGPQYFNVLLRVYSPVYEANAKKWRFRFGTNVEYFDISETNIAKDAIKRGGALIDDLYHVKAKLDQSINSKGNIKNEYSIVEVIEFRQAPAIVQTEMEINDDNA